MTNADRIRNMNDEDSLTCCPSLLGSIEREMNKKDLIASLINAVEEWLEETQGESAAIISGPDYYLLSNKFMVIPDIENLYKRTADKEK